MRFLSSRSRPPKEFLRRGVFPRRRGPRARLRDWPLPARSGVARPDAWRQRRSRRRDRDRAAQLLLRGVTKSKFLAAAREQQDPVAAPRSVGYAPMSSARTAFASTAVVLSAGVMGVLTLGLVTSDDANPGDWNYTFKLAQERIETLARGDGKVDIQINHTENRIQELRERGENASAGTSSGCARSSPSSRASPARKSLTPSSRPRSRLFTRRSIRCSTPSPKSRRHRRSKTRKTPPDNLLDAAGLGGSTTLPTVEPTPTVPIEEPSTTATPDRPRRRNRRRRHNRRQRRSPPKLRCRPAVRRNRWRVPLPPTRRPANPRLTSRLPLGAERS